MVSKRFMPKQKNRALPTLQSDKHSKHQTPKGMINTYYHIFSGITSIFLERIGRIMDKFLEIVYSNQLADSDKGDKFEDFFKPLMNKLKETVSEELYRDFEDLFLTCAVDNNRFYAVEGMKLAIGIMDGTYIPTV